MNILYLTVASDDYVDGVIALYNSLKKHDNFNHDFKIIYHPQYCPLSEYSKNKLLNIYNKFIFQESNLNEFKVENLKIKHPRFNYACLLSFYAFNQPNYDKIIFLDSDLIFLKSIKHLETLEGEFISAIDKPSKIDFFKPILKSNKLQINVGLMIISGKHNSLETFNKLIKIMKSKRRVKLPDQEVINEYLDNEIIVLLPLEYNKQVREFYTDDKIENLDKIIQENICLHFCGPKPWLEGNIRTKKMETIWFEYFNIFGKRITEYQLNNFENEITIGIKTFLRPKSLKYCLMRLRQYYKKIKILVADDSVELNKIINKKFCNRFNCEYLDLPFDTGLGYGRNQMILKTKTKYYLTLDDDSLIDYRFDLKKLYELIETTDRDLISVQRGVTKRHSKHYYHYFHSVDKYSNENYGKYFIRYDQKMSKDRLIKNILGFDLYQAHLINENYLGKTNILKNNLYENDIKIGQHQLHFSKLYLKNIKIGYCPNLIIGEKIHYPKEYLEYRTRKTNWIKPNDIILWKI